MLHHLMVHAKLAGTQRMMHKRMALHRRSTRVAYDMDYRHELRIRARVAAVCAELSRAKGRHERSGAGYTAIAICGV